jgi:gamma-glutamylputrescine oxidase
MIERSVWIPDVPAPHPPPPRGPLPQDISNVDVAVVGGGLAGLSIAYHLLLRQPGLRVVVLEANELGSGASGRNTGMVGPGVGQDLLALVRRLGDARAELVYRHSLGAVTRLFELAAAEQIDCDAVQAGQILWARSVAARRRLAAQAQWLATRDLPHEVLDDTVLQATLRLPRSGGAGRGLPAALRLPVAGLVDPARLVAGLARAAQRRGAVLLEHCRVIGLDDGGSGGGMRVALQGGARIDADQAVLATAGYTAALGWLRGRVIPLRLQALATTPVPPELLEGLGWPRREGIIEARRIFSYFRLAADGRLVFGGGAPRPCPHESLDADALPQRAAVDLERRLFEMFPDLVRAGVRVSHRWSGTIGYVLDGLPAIGQSRSHQRVFHAVGWSGHGLALSVAAGDWLAQRILGRVGNDSDTSSPAWFRHEPPRLPFEFMHGPATRLAVGALQWLDAVR